jgi:hypothetical protein
VIQSCIVLGACSRGLGRSTYLLSYGAIDSIQKVHNFNVFDLAANANCDSHTMPATSSSRFPLHCRDVAS